MIHTRVPFSFVTLCYSLCGPADSPLNSRCTVLLRPRRRDLRDGRARLIQFFSGRTSANNMPVPVRQCAAAISFPGQGANTKDGKSLGSGKSKTGMRKANSYNMWCFIIFMVVLRVFTFVDADCWYEAQRFEEGVQVVTNEPCLNCTCSRGALLCYLRVCPRLPNPPPSGCILLHRYKACCPELICSDIPAGNSIEARSQVEDEMLEVDQVQMKNACISNGSIYAPGSAMDSSTTCEFCYCISGEQRCVRPKCLLPLDGCTASYDAEDCCPTRYNCTRDLFTTTSTTTLAPREYETQGGCVVDGSFYPEGGKVLGIGHSACDNCYCLRGLVRCEPLSCASPLLGCTPVIRAGECCAASYNCSGAIETQPEPNYGQFPTVSKEYAKLHKQVQQHKRTTPRTEKPLVNNVPYYVIAESTKEKQGEELKYPTTTSYLIPQTHNGTPNSTSSNTNRLITQSPFYYHLTNTTNALLHKAAHNTSQQRNNLHPEIYYVPTKVAARKPDIYREDPLATTIRHKKYTSSSELEQIQNALEERIIRGIIKSTEENQTDATSTTPTTQAETDINPVTVNKVEALNTEIDTESTSVDQQQTASYDSTTIRDGDLTTTDLGDSTTESTTTLFELVKLITLRTVSNTTDCNTETNALSVGNSTLDASLNVHNASRHSNTDLHLSETTTEQFVFTTLTSLEDTPTNDIANDIISTELTTMADGIDATTTENTDAKTVASKIKIALQNIQNILNGNKSLDYDYDYTAPTLPPSLPNLRIIPFVAADALDSKTDQTKTSSSYIEEKTFPFTNQFSPPAETEGGFVPKEPPIMINHFYNDYHTTNVNGVTQMPVVASLTNLPKTDENNCMMDTKEVKHGESVTSEGNCALCVCFYGRIVCHEPQCPLPQNGCHHSNKITRSTCCPEIVCDIDEFPTVVLDRHNSSSNSTIGEPVTPADPFKDVIRTEPAPDLQLLIGDMSNYMLKKTATTTSTTPTTTTSTSNSTQHEKDDFEDKDLSFHKIWDMLFNLDEATPPPILRASSTTKTTLEGIRTKQNIHNMASIKDIGNQNSLETRENLDNNLGLAWASSIAATKRQEHVPGLLKLAGCNIYGRMYRVGRIISELSGPCMECKCTEIGVQCENLTC